MRPGDSTGLLDEMFELGSMSCIFIHFWSCDQEIPMACWPKFRLDTCMSHVRFVWMRVWARLIILMHI